jgi:hypothetical protein
MGYQSSTYLSEINKFNTKNRFLRWLHDKVILTPGKREKLVKQEHVQIAKQVCLKVKSIKNNFSKTLSWTG